MLVLPNGSLCWLIKCAGNVRRTELFGIRCESQLEDDNWTLMLSNVNRKFRQVKIRILLAIKFARSTVRSNSLSRTLFAKISLPNS